MESSSPTPEHASSFLSGANPALGWQDLTDHRRGPLGTPADSRGRKVFRPTSLLTGHNLIVLVGSGTSLGQKVKGPSMAQLWQAATALPSFAR